MELVEGCFLVPESGLARRRVRAQFASDDTAVERFMMLL